MGVRAQRDDLPTVVAAGLLAYASADIAHHVLGHGGACLALGGRILSLTSVHVDCTVRGTAVDVAGPFANLIVGLLAAGVALRVRVTMRLFLALAGGSNLFWFSLQLAFSAATRTDDFAWALSEFDVSELLRYGLIALALVLYNLAVRVVRYLFIPFGPRPRVARMVWGPWFAAGIFACLTALFDHHPWLAISHYAAPQSWVLSVGLLFVPKGLDGGDAIVIPRQTGWLLAALFVVAASILFLGPGFAV